jgi:hypothetical protein
VVRIAKGQLQSEEWRVVTGFARARCRWIEPEMGRAAKTGWGPIEFSPDARRGKGNHPRPFARRKPRIVVGSSAAIHFKGHRKCAHCALSSFEER